MPSPDGSLIAYLSVSSTLEIRKAASLLTIRSIQLPQRFKYASVRWSPTCESLCKSSRIAVFNEHGVRIENLSGQESSAAIERGSGGMGKIVNAEFGRTDDEFVVFADFGSKVTIWNLVTGRSVEIKDPKFPTQRGFAYRPKSGHFALLSRPGPQDVVTLHATNSNSVVWKLNGPTVDAQGIRWSPDGRFLAVWDAPSLGYMLYIYTASGDLYKAYVAGTKEDIALGIKAVEWSPSGDVLAVSGYDKRVKILSTRTVSAKGLARQLLYVLTPISSLLSRSSTI